MKKLAKKKSVTSKRLKAKHASGSTGADQDIVGLLTMLVQKLTSFESKIDMVLSRITAQPIAVVVPKPQPVIVPPPKQGRENRYMHKAVCSDCGMDCEVPFKPRQDRQVYCKECFQKRKNNKGIFKPQEAHNLKEESPVHITPPVKTKEVKPNKSTKKKKTAVKKKTAIKKKKAKR